MSFDRAYPRRKDQRKPYRGSAAFAPSCRHGGSCPYCQGNRTIQARRVEVAARAALREWR